MEVVPCMCIYTLCSIYIVFFIMHTGAFYTENACTLSVAIVTVLVATGLSPVAIGSVLSCTDSCPVATGSV
jgi:hypothetical protein